MSEAVYRAFLHRSPATELRGMSVADLVRQVEAGAGGQKAAATRLGVSPSTLRRWKSGAATPSPRTGAGAKLRQLAKAFGRRARMGPRTEAKLRGSPDWRITGNVVVSSDARQRTIYPQRDLNPGSLNEVVDAFLRGDDREVEAAMDRVIDSWIPGASVGVAPVTDLRMGPRPGEEDLDM